MIRTMRCAPPIAPTCSETVSASQKRRVADILNREQLEALYRAPVEKLTDMAAGASAFLPG
jgi:hypothetical protein